MWNKDAPYRPESDKIKWDIVPFTRGIVLDVGCGVRKPFDHFIGVDNYADQALFGQVANPNLRIGDACNLSIFASSFFDAVFSSHLLEHIKDYKAALREWWRVLKVGGHLILYLPHKDFYPNIGQPGSNPDHKHDFLPGDVLEAMRELGFEGELIRCEDRNEKDEYSFLIIFKRGVEGSGWVEALPAERPKQTAIVARYGAFGDILQTLEVCRLLKSHGYHVTLNTTENGKLVAEGCPYVDAYLLQDTDQVPNTELGNWFHHLSESCDLFVNLSESVEGALLALPGRPTYYWPKQARELYMNLNYVQFMCSIANIPNYRANDCQQQFYPFPEEVEWAMDQKAKIAGPMVVFSLSGSSVHKRWPHMDGLIARFLQTSDDGVIILAGGPAESILEQGWEKEDRVWKRCGQLTIRQTMALAHVADLVIGPETGVLNSVAARPMPKIVFLSHSSNENLTRDWKNTVPMTPQGTSCYPCHMMHYGFETCKMHAESFTAQCAWDISLDRVWTYFAERLGLPFAPKVIPIKPANPGPDNMRESALTGAVKRIFG
jgi:ADP-heptose:LPS heptosyltransferase